MRGLFNYLQNYEAWKTGSQGKARVYMGLIALFSSYAQRNFPYHIEGGGGQSQLEHFPSLFNLLLSPPHARFR